MKPLVTIRCLRAWAAHNATFSLGEEYRVPQFIAAILLRIGYVEVVGEDVEEWHLVSEGMGVSK